MRAEMLGCRRIMPTRTARLPWKNCIASLPGLRYACWREVLVAQALLPVLFCAELSDARQTSQLLHFVAGLTWRTGKSACATGVDVNFRFWPNHKFQITGSASCYINVRFAKRLPTRRCTATSLFAAN